MLPGGKSAGFLMGRGVATLPMNLKVSEMPIEQGRGDDLGSFAYALELHNVSQY